MEKYSYEKAYEEAAKMQEKIKKDEARNYYDAERLVEKEDEEKARLKKYEKSFGNEAEMIIAELLKEAPFIKSAELGTDNEDKKGKSDVWFNFRGDEITDPTALQLTTSSNPEKVSSKREKLPPFAKKEYRNDAQIKFDKKADLVFVHCDKIYLGRKWNEYLEKKKENSNTTLTSVLGKKFVIDIFLQILNGLGKTNPPKKTMLLNFLKEFENSL
ncbi:MAG: hypothetical protein NT136_00400 [Candidatus Moranbacteria bacterium]|nr:hypothetical protein [Candidatus Moranbacteria bacterium]